METNVLFSMKLNKRYIYKAKVTPSYPKCKFELGKSQEGKDSYRCKE
jgi:hypothetical protein